jgi:hypothetical protein
MSLIFRRGIASMASLKKASKVVCIGRNYACVPLGPIGCRDKADRDAVTTSRN